MSEAPDWISLRVMCVDEDKGYGRLLDRIFRNLGVRDITLATSVEEAGLGFDDAPYNFIFVSRTDENSLGTTLTTYLRDKKVTPAPNVPIFWMVDEGTLDVVTTAIKTGADHVLVRPISIADMESTIKRLSANPALKTSDAKYIGPCRRRLPSKVYGPFSGKDRRLQSTEEPATG